MPEVLDSLLLNCSPGLFARNEPLPMIVSFLLMVAPPYELGEGSTISVSPLAAPLTAAWRVVKLALMPGLLFTRQVVAKESKQNSVIKSAIKSVDFFMMKKLKGLKIKGLILGLKRSYWSGRLPFTSGGSFIEWCANCFMIKGLIKKYLVDCFLKART